MGRGREDGGWVVLFIAFPVVAWLDDRQNVDTDTNRPKRNVGVGGGGEQGTCRVPINSGAASVRGHRRTPPPPPRPCPGVPWVVEAMEECGVRGVGFAEPNGKKTHTRKR